MIPFFRMPTSLYFPNCLCAWIIQFLNLTHRTQKWIWKKDSSRPCRIQQTTSCLVMIPNTMRWVQAASLTTNYVTNNDIFLSNVVYKRSVVRGQKKQTIRADKSSWASRLLGWQVFGVLGSRQKLPHLQHKFSFRSQRSSDIPLSKIQFVQWALRYAATRSRAYDVWNRFRRDVWPHRLLRHLVWESNPQANEGYESEGYPTPQSLAIRQTFRLLHANSSFLGPRERR